MNVIVGFYKSQTPSNVFLRMINFFLKKVQNLHKVPHEKLHKEKQELKWFLHVYGEIHKDCDSSE